MINDLPVHLQTYSQQEKEVPRYVDLFMQEVGLDQSVEKVSGHCV